MRRLRFALLAGVLAVAAIPVALALAQTATAPTVTSAAATAISNTSATANGSVNPNSTATQYAVQFGPTASYGEETGLTSAGAGNAATNVAVALTGLQSGTLHHFRIIAINAGGTSVGGDETFTTSGTAPAPSTPATASTGSSSAVSQAGATVAGTVNPQGKSTEYYFEYGQTANYGFETGGQTATGSSSISVSATLTGLPSGTTFHYRVVAINAGGVTLGHDATFTTTNPPAVTSAAATSVTNDSVVLNGAVNPNGHSSTYYFQYGTTTAYGLQTAPAGAGSGTSEVAVNAEVTALMPSATYHFRLVSTSNQGTSYGSDETVTTAGAPITTSTVRLMGHMGFVSPGNVIGVEVGCFGPNPCVGSFKLTVNGKTIGGGNFKESANTGGFVNIKLNATGKADLKGNRVNHLLVTNVTVTTTAGQTIDGRLSLARWIWKD
jgi:hypothetical protein